MYRLYCFIFVMIGVVNSQNKYTSKSDDDSTGIDVIDLSLPTTWKFMSDYYSSIERYWKVCINCGIPGLGTAMHLEHSTSTSSAMYPAVIPTDYLLTRLEIIDVSHLVQLHQSLILSLDVALQWLVLKHDPLEPTLLLFKFGWKEDLSVKLRSCVCKIPGISYELAEWIVSHLPHVMGVATDAPTLESEETREMTSRTVANLLGKSGIYMIENVNLKRIMPEHGCMTLAMPLKMQHTNYVPTRLTAFCSKHKGQQHVVLALKDKTNDPLLPSRINDVNLEEILN